MQAALTGSWMLGLPGLSLPVRMGGSWEPSSAP
jgi:hypothetical protein